MFCWLDNSVGGIEGAGQRARSRLQLLVVVAASPNVAALVEKTGEIKGEAVAVKLGMILPPNTHHRLISWN